MLKEVSIIIISLPCKGADATSLLKDPISITLHREDDESSPKPTIRVACPYFRSVKPLLEYRDIAAQEQNFCIAGLADTRASLDWFDNALSDPKNIRNRGNYKRLISSAREMAPKCIQKHPK